MAGETDLATLISSMRPVLSPATYVFAHVSPSVEMPADISPLMTFREEEGLTLILPREDAEASSLACSFPCRMITLSVHPALEAVGFLAAVTARLAEAGIPVNAGSAFHHDHVFVPPERAEEALRILETMAANAVS